MSDAAPILAGLLAVIAVVVILARRLRIPGPILLVPVGLGIALVPGVPHVRLDPHLVLTLLLPPLVYAAAVETSWPDFRANLRPIALLAVGGVLFTTAAVAVAAHVLFGLSWAVACVLGAVVSPPDTVAATAIAGQMAVPRRIAAILQGEGLVNDATALVLYRFATAAAVYGTFSLWRASLTFGAVVVGELAWGVVVGWAVLWARRWANDDRAEVTLSLLTPFAAFLPAEHLGGSGVLATAVAGLWVGWNGWTATSPATRLQGRFFWDLIVFLVEGLLFLVTGLQFREIRRGLAADTWPQLLGYGAALCVFVIVLRFLWVFMAAYLPRRMRKVGRGGGGTDPPWTGPFVASLAGMRGAISLAAALALPTVMETTGHPRFPDRPLVIFLTFCVILVTLVGQGLALPMVIRRLGLEAEGRAEREAEDRRTWDARIAASRASLARLDELAAAGGYPTEVLLALRRRHEARVLHLSHHRAEDDARGDQADAAARELLAAARRRLYELRRRGELGDEASRQIEHELDLDEARAV